MDYAIPSSQLPEGVKVFVLAAGKDAAVQSEMNKWFAEGKGKIYVVHTSRLVRGTDIVFIYEYAAVKPPVHVQPPRLPEPKPAPKY